MLTVCCDAWMSPETSTCMIQADACQGSQEPIAVVQASPFDLGACPSGAVFCDVLVYPTAGSCCNWDCRAEPACLSGAEWSCCQGYCKELFDDMGREQPNTNPACAQGYGGTAQACCTGTQIIRPPLLPDESTEWIVRFGNVLGSIDASASDDAAEPDRAGVDAAAPPSVPAPELAPLPSPPVSTPACVPQTCAELGQTCAVGDDGCGHRLVCESACPPSGCAVGNAPAGARGVGLAAAVWIMGLWGGRRRR